MDAKISRTVRRLIGAVKLLSLEHRTIVRQRFVVKHNELQLTRNLILRGAIVDRPDGGVRSFLTLKTLEEFVEVFVTLPPGERANIIGGIPATPTIEERVERQMQKAKPKGKPRGAIPLTTDWEIKAAKIIRRSRELDLEGLCYEFRKERLETPAELREKFPRMPTNMVDAYNYRSTVRPLSYRKMLRNWRSNFTRRIDSLDARASKDSSEAALKRSTKPAKSAAKRQV